MQGNRERTFSYPSWLPWARTVGLLVVLVVPTVLCLLLLLFEPPASPVQLIAGWLVAAFLVVSTAWYLRRWARYFAEPHTITVTRNGLIGRPIHGPPVEIEWGQIASVDQTRWPLHATRLYARDGHRTIVFNEELPGYRELTRIVSEQMRAREE